MNIADEATGSHLKAKVYSVRQVAEICPRQVTRDINQSFIRYGLPKVIKIDNGRPLAVPNTTNIPTLSVLWWIGLGIKVIQNTPCRPQQNGIVEGLQGTMKNWSNPSRQPNMEALQARLDEESDFQRNHYRIPAKSYKTRAQLYPQLENNPRKYSPRLFDMQRVYDYLSQKVWDRMVSKRGQIGFFGKNLYVGIAYAESQVTITFDPLEQQWLIRKTDGTLLKTSLALVPQQEEILDFAICQRTKGTT